MVLIDDVAMKMERIKNQAIKAPEFTDRADEKYVEEVSSFTIDR